MKGLLGLVIGALLFIGLNVLWDCLLLREECASVLDNGQWSVVFAALFIIFALVALYVYGVQKSSNASWKKKKLYLVLKDEVTPSFVWTLVLFVVVGFLARMFSNQFITDPRDYYRWNGLVLLCLAMSYQLPIYRRIVNWYRKNWK